ESVQINSEKRMSSRTVALILILILIVSGVLAYIFNIGGLKEKTSNIFETIFKNKTDKELEQEKVLEKEIEKNEILELQTELDSLKFDLELKQNQLEEKETKLLEREKEIEE